MFNNNFDQYFIGKRDNLSIEMRLTLSSKYKHEQYFSSRSGRGNVKRGISVTLSKEKQSQCCSSNNNQSYAQSKNDPCQQKNSVNNMSMIFNTINLQNTTPRDKISQKVTQSHLQIDPHTNQKQNAQSIKEDMKQSKSPKSNMIGVYFMTTKQKQQAKKESQKLDQHIKKLQLEIYNTRSKITQTKYLYQNTNNNNSITINSNNKKYKNSDIKNTIKYNHHYSQTQSIINPNQTYFSNINHPSQFNSPTNKSKLNLSQINKKSLLINDKKYAQNQLPISPSSSQPPNPFLLRQILTSQKQQVIKNPRMSQNLNKNKTQQIHLLQSTNLRQSSKKTINQKISIKNKKSSSVNRQNLSKKDHKSSKRNNSESKKNSTKFHQKRSFSVNLKESFKHEIISNKKKSLNLSCQDNIYLKPKKPIVSNPNFKKQNCLSIDSRKQQKSIQNSVKFKKGHKNNKNQMFSNEILTKKVSSKRKKPTF